MLIGLAIVALPTPWGWIGLAVASAGALLCPRIMWQNTTAVFRRPVVWLWVAWWLLIAASIAWSPDLSLSHWQSLLMLLLIPAVASLRAHRNAVVLAIAIGISINVCVQVLQWGHVLQSERYPWPWIAPGLFDYPPFAGIWTATVLLLLLPLLSKASTLIRALPRLMLCGSCLIGALLASSKVSLLAGSVGVVLVGLVLVLRRPTPWGRAAVCSVIAATITIALWQGFKKDSVGHRVFRSLSHDIETATTAPQQPATKVTEQKTLDTTSQQAEGLSATPRPAPELQATQRIPSRKQQTRMQTSFGLRTLWWNATGDIVMEAPLLGHGAGSTRDQLARAERHLPPDLGAGIDNFIIEDPHSSLLATAIEQGLLGVGLLLTCICTALWMTLRATLRDVRYIGLTGAWCMLCAGALVHTLQFSPWMTALGTVMIVLSAWLPPKTPASLSTDDTTQI